ncbi:MAG: PstS family phosphate ABC transporter substrate-binding protein [Bacteroidia bacterium]
MRINYLVLILILAGFACNNTTNQELDTPTSGEITVACDESLYPVIDAEHQVFESHYPKAKLNLIYTSEPEAIKLMLADSARIAIVTRDLYPEELEVLKSQKISKVRTVPIAYDAIAFILNKENNDTSFTLEQLTSILAGETNNWNKINPKSNLGDINVVFDNPASGAIRMLKDSLLNGKDLGKNCYAVKSNPEVIEYVKNNKNAIGIIGTSWISDTEDTEVKMFLNSIHVAEIKPINVRISSLTNKPLQGNVALKQYPLWRTVNFINREARMGLATGFKSFVAGDTGQRVILKAGLVPYYAPIRVVELKEQK